MVSTDEKSKRHEEYQYLNACRDILNSCELTENRTDIKSLELFGTQMRYSLANDTIPLLTTKKMAVKSITKELLWLLRGDTNGESLLNEGVKIWSDNGTREFLDKRGLSHYETNDLGPIYGFQWRHSGAEYKGCKADYSGQGIDQIANVIETLKSNPNDRRMIVCAWAPSDIPKMALPPCHCLFQFFVKDGNLDCQMYQRSADMGLGVPFNIASYSILTHIIAKICGLKPRYFIHTLGNYHIYENQIESLKIQIEREPKPFPKLKINERGQKCVEDFVADDFEIVDYEHHPAIFMKMAV